MAFYTLALMQRKAPVQSRGFAKLKIVSPFWQAVPKLLDEIAQTVEAGGMLTGNFQVTRKGALFSDSTEQTTPFALP